jgi:CDP-glycerol glycerophosphotransferase
MINLRTSPEFQALADSIAHLSKNRKIYFVPSPGNWGDALINAGTHQFFDFFDFKYEVILRSELMTKLTQVPEVDVLDALIIVGGGGGWCETWSSTRSFVHEISLRVTKVVVLPTTYDLEAIEGTGENVVFFARDMTLSRSRIAQAKFCHDMAFFLSVDVPRESVLLPRVVALRIDKERSTQAETFDFSVDMSLLGDAFSSVLPLFQIINRFERVVSDRLHIAIAGCLLGKDVTLLPGIYPKSHGVYSASMCDNYPDSRFSEWGEFQFWPLNELSTPGVSVP